MCKFQNTSCKTEMRVARIEWTEGRVKLVKGASEALGGRRDSWGEGGVRVGMNQTKNEPKGGRASSSSWTELSDSEAKQAFHQGYY